MYYNKFVNNNRIIWWNSPIGQKGNTMSLLIIILLPIAILMALSKKRK